MIRPARRVLYRRLADDEEEVWSVDLTGSFARSLGPAVGDYLLGNGIVSS